MRRTITILVTLLLLAPAALSQENFLRVGGAFTSGDDESSKLQQYEVIPDSDALFALHMHYDLGSGQYVTLSGEKLFVGDERARLDFGQRGGWRVGIRLDRNQNWFSNVARTLFRDAGGGRFTVDDSIRTAVQNAGAAGSLGPYADRAAPVDLRSKRRTLGVDFLAPFADDAYALFGGIEEQARSGRKAITYGMFRGGVPNGPDQRIFELAAPVDDSTQNARLGLEYAKGPLYLMTQAFVSRYSNEINALRFDNPTRITNSATAGGAVLQASTWPDNRAFTVDFQGAVTLPRRHRLAFSYSEGRMRQDDDLLPYSLNTAVDVPTLRPPVSAVDARIDTKSYLIRLTGDPGRFGYQVSYRGYELENKTPRVLFEETVRMDTVAEGPFETEPADWKKNVFKAGVHFTPVDWVRLGVDYDLEKWKRPERRVTENTVKALRGTADFRFSHWASARVSYTDAKQEEDSLGAPADGDQPRARQYDVAERDTTQYELHLTVTPTERLMLGGSVARGDNDFPGTVFGATKDNYRNYGLDVSYAFGERVSVFANYVNEKFEWDQRSNYSTGTPAPADRWRTETRDETDTYQFGLNAQATPQLLFAVDYTYSDGVSRQACFFAEGGSSSGNCTFPTSSSNPNFPVTVYSGWPDVKTKFTWLKVRGQYEISKALAAGVEYWRYKFEGDDWALDVMNVFMGDFDPVTAGVRFSTFLGARVPDYDADIYRAYLDYRF